MHFIAYCAFVSGFSAKTVTPKEPLPKYLIYFNSAIFVTKSSGLSALTKLRADSVLWSCFAAFICKLCRYLAAVFYNKIIIDIYLFNNLFFKHFFTQSQTNSMFMCHILI